MPRIKVRDKSTGVINSIEWDKDRPPTPGEIRDLVSQNTGESFGVQDSKADDVPAPVPLPNHGSVDAPDSGFLSNLFKRDDSGIANRLQTSVDTLYGGDKSVLPPIPGVTRPILPKWDTPTDTGDMIGDNVVNIGKGLYNNVAVPSSSLLGAATDYVANSGISAGIGKLRGLLRPTAIPDAVGAGESLSRAGVSAGPAEVASPGPMPVADIPDIPEVSRPRVSSPSAMPELDVPARGGNNISEDTGLSSPPPQRSAPIPRAGRKIIDAAETSGVPEIQAAAKEVKTLTPWEQTKQDWTNAVTTQIAKTGEAGKKIVTALDRARVSGESAAGTRVQTYQDAVKGLSDPEFDQLVDVLDKGVGKDEVIHPKVQAAYEQIKPIADEMGKQAIDSKMGYLTSEGKQIPFQPRENYFPHLLPKDAEGKAGKDIIDSIMSKEGISRGDAEKIVKNARNYGERAVSAQHGREVHFDNFRRDREVFPQHIYDMSMRISRAKELGPMDIASGPLADLVEQTDNPNLVRRNLKRVLGRDEQVTGSSLRGKFIAKVNQAEVISHLSQFTIGNFNQNAMTAMNSNTRDMMGALAKRLVDKREFYRGAQRAGVLESTMQDMYRETGGARAVTNKLYGIKASEEFNRALAAQTGRNKAERLFQSLKSAPENVRARTQLEDMLKQPVTDEMLAQPKLSAEHSSQAAGRFTQNVQGRAQAQDVPYMWTSQPEMNALLLFKKYAFQQGRIMARTLAENPVKAATLGPILLQATGELTGDAKAVLKGAGKSMVSGKNEIPAEVESRGSSVAKVTGSKNQLLNRMTENYLQAWALGLPGDMLQAVAGGDSKRAIEFLTGPVVSDAANLAVESVNAARGRPNALAKDAIRRIPFVGSGLASSSFFKKKSKKSVLD